MRPAESVITEAVNGKTKDLAQIYEVSEARMFQLLSTHCPYQKAKLLVRAIAQVNVAGVRLIKADLDALFAELLGDTPEVTVADLHKETCEAVQSILDDAPVAVKKKEIREAIVASEGMLQSLDTRETAKNAVNDFRQRNGRVH